MRSVLSCWCTAWVVITCEEILAYRPLKKTFRWRGCWCHKVILRTMCFNALLPKAKLLWFCLLQNLLQGQAHLPAGLWRWWRDSIRGEITPFTTGYHFIKKILTVFQLHCKQCVVLVKKGKNVKGTDKVVSTTLRIDITTALIYFLASSNFLLASACSIGVCSKLHC